MIGVFCGIFPCQGHGCSILERRFQRHAGTVSHADRTEFRKKLFRLFFVVIRVVCRRISHHWMALGTAPNAIQLPNVILSVAKDLRAAGAGRAVAVLEKLSNLGVRKARAVS